jgi:CheY-like chemotaxis protein
MLHRLIGDRIRTVVRLDADAGSANVDRGQLEQVVTNLVVNARDAIDDTGRITIATRNEHVSPRGSHPELDTGDWVIVSVTDTGSGIPEGLRSRIFEPFFSTKPPGEGTGLGLSTCHGIVKGMGGLITVESEPGVGSTFRVCLPRAAEERRDPDRRGAPASAPVGHEVVLIVEDHTELLDVARRILLRQGYTVYAAVDETEAWALVDEMGRAPDLLVTDLHLPTGDGRDLVRRMKERFPGVKCLVTSGSAPPPAQGEPGVPFLPKPYTLPTLASAVRDALDGRSGPALGREA